MQLSSAGPPRPTKLAGLVQTTVAVHHLADALVTAQIMDDTPQHAKANAPETLL